MLVWHPFHDSYFHSCILHERPCVQTDTWYWQYCMMVPLVAPSMDAFMDTFSHILPWCWLCCKHHIFWSHADGRRVCRVASDWDTVIVASTHPHWSSRTSRYYKGANTKGPALILYHSATLYKLAFRYIAGCLDYTWRIAAQVYPPHDFSRPHFRDSHCIALFLRYLGADMPIGVLDPGDGNDDTCSGQFSLWRCIFHACDHCSYLGMWLWQSIQFLNVAYQSFDIK